LQKPRSTHESREFHAAAMLKMKSTPFALLSICCLAMAQLHAADPAVSGKQKVKAKRDAVWAPVADVPGLPRVLLLGDSISMGYTVPVRTLLAGKANVHRPPENCFESGNGLKKLEAWLGTGKWDVIHFNFGLHDNKYVDASGTLVAVDKGKVVTTPEQYEKNLRELIARMKQTGAKLICATTTPVPANTNGRREGSERAYNAAVLKVAQETGIIVDDLYTFVTKHTDAQQLPNNVHFTEKGYQQLAEVVAGKIEAALPKR
jgi:hypothetical protein